MLKDTHPDALVDTLARQAEERARNLYLSHRYLCAEAVLVTIDQSLEGGLGPDRASALAAPFSMAMGESGCVCGALSGSVLACGLFVGGDNDFGGPRAAREASRTLHDEFKADHGATCCRALSRKVRDNPKEHFRQCATLTGKASARALRLVLALRPELIHTADEEYLRRRDTKTATLLHRLRRMIKAF